MKRKPKIKPKNDTAEIWGAGGIVVGVLLLGFAIGWGCASLMQEEKQPVIIRFGEPPPPVIQEPARKYQDLHLL